MKKRATTTARAGFFDLILPREGHLEVRAFLAKRKGAARQWWPRLDDPAAIDAAVTRAAATDRDVYFGCASRRDSTGGDLAHCLRLDALFTDVDFKTTPEPVARERLARFALKPSAEVDSGGGLHCYWCLRHPLTFPADVTRARALLRRLALALGGDLSAAEPARVLRVPGTVNYKYTPPRAVTIERLDPERRYTPDDFDAVLDHEPAVTASGFTMPEILTEPGRNDALYKSGRSMKAKGWSEAAIAAAMRAENATRCQPPLDDDELAELIDNVLTQPDRADFRGPSGERGAEAGDGPIRYRLKARGSTPTPAAYAFVPAFPAEHFVGAFIAAASARYDAALEYFELTALTVLSAATPTLRAKLAQYRDAGLSTGLYGLLVGKTTSSRKSTAKDYGLDLLKAAIPNAVLPDQMSPESFTEQLAVRGGQSAVWGVDEFTPMLVKLHHVRYMTGFLEQLLAIYDGRDYTATRRSKRDKETGEMHADEDRAIDPHLSILGCSTPSIFRQLTLDDVETGFLPRFAIVYPTAKPARQPIGQLTAAMTEARDELIDWVRAVHARATPGGAVDFEDAALVRLDDVDRRIEDASGDDESGEGKDETRRLLLKRLPGMVTKVAMLAAAGRPAVRRAPTGRPLRLTVTAEDVGAAVTVVERWRASAERFVAEIGLSAFERHLTAAARLAQTRGRVARSVVAQNVHVSKWELDQIQSTLVDRGQIEVDDTQPPKGRGGHAKIFWTWVGTSAP